MAQTASNVRIDKPLTTGSAWLAPKGTALPTDATTALDAAYKCPGYLDPAGIRRTPARTVGKQYAYGGDLVATTEAEDSWVIALDMIEANAVSEGVFFGSGNVTEDTTTTHLRTTQITADPFEEHVLVIETIANGLHTREVWESVKISSRGEVTSVDDAIRKYPVVFTAIAGANGYGTKYEELLAS